MPQTRFMAWEIVLEIVMLTPNPYDSYLKFREWGSAG